MRAPANNAKSLLPLIEIIISVLIFAIAAVLSLKIFLLSRDMGIKAQETSSALFCAQSVVERIKSSTSEDELLDNIAYVFGDAPASTEINGTYKMIYDENWSPVFGEPQKNKVNFTMTLDITPTRTDAGVVYDFKVDVVRNKYYSFIYSGESSTPELVSLVNAKFIGGRS